MGLVGVVDFYYRVGGGWGSVGQEAGIILFSFFNFCFVFVFCCLTFSALSFFFIFSVSVSFK